jgi:hypothetical protein
MVSTSRGFTVWESMISTDTESLHASAQRRQKPTCGPQATTETSLPSLSTLALPRLKVGDSS